MKMCFEVFITKSQAISCIKPRRFNLKILKIPIPILSTSHTLTCCREGGRGEMSIVQYMDSVILIIGKKSNLCIEYSQITRDSIFIYQRFSRWPPFWHSEHSLAKFALHQKSIIRLHSNGKILLISNQWPRFVNRKFFVPFAVVSHYLPPLLWRWNIKSKAFYSAISGTSVWGSSSS